MSRYPAKIAVTKLTYLGTEKPSRSIERKNDVVYAHFIEWKPFCGTISAAIKSGKIPFSGMVVIDGEKTRGFKAGMPVTGVAGITRGFATRVQTVRLPRALVQPLYDHKKDALLELTAERQSGGGTRLSGMGDSGYLFTTSITSAISPGKYEIQLFKLN